jgi:DNA-binding HxlR family transcriptional regulator
MRTYGDGCSAAHALDLIGQRWALLVVRELLLGPKRFTDLRSGLPQASPNVLAQRLRELEEAGVVRRRRLAPPAGSWVYELTARGHELEGVLIDLARWGQRSPLHDTAAEASVDAVLLALRSRFDAETGRGLEVTLSLHIGEHVFTIRVGGGRLAVDRSDVAGPDAVIDTDLRTFASLVTGGGDLAETVARGGLTITGDADAVAALLGALTPHPAAPA